MAHKTFISYKYSESRELRDRIIKAMGSDAAYYTGEASRAECGTLGVRASCRSGHDLCSQAAARFPLQAFQSRFQEAQFAVRV